jgi:peptide/nickel transport system substrate-binding protein
MLAQYFETNNTPRVGYSNPEVDALLKQERQTFDFSARLKILQKAMSKITEEAPGHFLWRHKMAYGLAKSIDFQPLPGSEVWGWKIKLKPGRS